MLKDKLTLVVHSCDKFSDLWDAHFYLLNMNWRDRDLATYLVTDKQTEKRYDGVKVISTGDNAELSERTGEMLKHINTEYVLITLDDYFPIYEIKTDAIAKIVDKMVEHDLDYVRLFKRPESDDKITGSESLYWIDLNCEKDTNYLVNLYVGIWRKSFIEKTVREPLDAWSYELSLSKIAREVNAKCAMSKGNEFLTIDVVRKGQLLHKANRYLKKRDLYHGSRTVISWKAEWRINILTFIKDHTSQAFVDWGKGILRRRGQQFYSDN